jgi:hypothetical protein
MKYMKEILALLVLILLVVGYFYLNNNTVEGLGDKQNLSKIQKQADKEAKVYIKDQQSHFGARKLDTKELGAHGDTQFIKVSEDKHKQNYEGGKLVLEKQYAAEDKELSETERRIKKCKDINRLKSCSLLEDAYEDGTGCGYCLDSDMIAFGNKTGPIEDVCGGGGSKNTWVAPGPNVAFECQKAKDRAYCSKMKDCGDTSVSDRCAWCPISGKGMAKKENKDGGWVPKYKDDKCDWPYEGIKTNVKWFGADHKKYGDLDIGRGSCKKDTDCAPGLKCGQNPHKSKNKIGLKGKNNEFGKSQDYCYDPEFAGMNGPLVPVGECAKFGQRFPCMGPQMLTGPHSEACYQDLWKKSGCRGKVMNRLSEQGSWGSKLAKMWNASGYTNVMKSMMGLNVDMDSKDYSTAKRATKVCRGTDVDACEDRFVNESKKVKRPLDCLVNKYNESGCSKDGRLHPNNITKTVSDDARKKHGVGKEWELGTFYRWKPQDYLNKLKGVKQRADKLTAASNIDTYDEGIKLYENCYGKPPSTSTFPAKKPCWKDFAEIMKRSHKNVVISKDGQRIVYNKDPIGVKNAFMKNSNLNRTRMAGEGKTGHDWGNSKTIKKADYDKPYFPFWRFVKNSRDIYQGGGAGKWKSKWPEFKKRMLKVNGVQDLGDDTLLCAPFMGVGRTLRNYKLAKKKSLAHIPVNGKCGSCSLVPAGQCQEGCPKSSTPDGSRNACANKNKGKKPSICTVPFGNVITKKMWMMPEFPYWEFMRILQRFEN